MFWRTRRSRASRTNRVSIILAAVVVATVVGAFSSSTVAEGPGSSSPLGVYAGALSPETTSAFGGAVGQQPTFAMDFLNGSSWSTLVNSAPTYMSTWSSSGYTMIWGVPMLPNSFSPDSNVADKSGSAYGLVQGASGVYNSYFLKLAEEMVAGGQGSAIIRPGWEFNGSWFPWAAKGQAAAFVGYWQQIVTTMRSVAGQDFRFEWNPTAGDQGVGDLANFYPGSAYVDYIGLDVYDQTWATYAGISSEWHTYLTEPYGLNWLAWFAASEGKPITLPEWGLDPDPSSNDGGQVSQPGTEVGGGDDPTFINDMAQWIKQNDVFDATYWDYGSSRLSRSSNPNSYAAFVSDFGAGSTSAGSPPSSTTTTLPVATTTTTTTMATTPTTTRTTVGTTPTTTRGSGGNGGTGGSRASGPRPGNSTPATDPLTFSTERIEHSAARVVTSRKVQFSAVIQTLPSRKVGPAGPITWTVTSAYGTPVQCLAADSGRDPTNGRTSCTVPPGQLSAAAGPYTVAVHYAGARNVAPSMATLVQRVARAGSTTEIEVDPELLHGHMVEIAAAVNSRPTGLKTPAGTVTFSVWGKTGQSIPCQADATVTLVTGVATCTFGVNASVQAPYFVKVTYHGDGDFSPTTSKMRVLMVRGQSVFFQP
jgi:hypothetical protein